MGRLYGVGLINRTQMRDLSLESLLNDESFDRDNYVHEGEFDYIFDMNNILNTDVGRYTKVYKTLNGAKRLRDSYGDGSNIIMKLRYAVPNPNGGWKRNYSGNQHIPVIIDITEKWDNLIDERIEVVTKKFNEDIDRLKSKKSK